MVQLPLLSRLGFPRSYLAEGLGGRGARGEAVGPGGHLRGAGVSIGALSRGYFLTEDRGSPVAVLPILGVYLIAQRQIVESFAMSGVKG